MHLCFVIYRNDLFDKFNDYFTEITNYKIDDELEQAGPRNGCWTDYSPDNINYMVTGIKRRMKTVTREFSGKRC